MQRISVNLINDCGGDQFKYNNDLHAIENKNYALQKPFKPFKIDLLIQL